MMSPEILTQLPDDYEPPDQPRPTRERTVLIKEMWVRECDEPPGCPAANPLQPCCGEGHWEKVEEH